MSFAALPPEVKRRMQRESLKPAPLRNEAFYRILRSIPRGYVSTYGKVAAAAGYPLYHRAVAKFLRGELAGSLPWQRVLGAGGEIRLRGDAALEQRRRLRAEGVRFVRDRVDMEAHEHQFRTWEL